MSVDFKNHTVEKIGGTSMSRLDELLEPLFKDSQPGYGRIFVVSAFGGITDALLEHKKTGEKVRITVNPKEGGSLLDTLGSKPDKEEEDDGDAGGQ